MRHRVDGRKLGRTTAHRTALFRNMAASLIEHGRIHTTLPKAKELKRVADRLVTLGKQNNLHARREAFSRIRNRRAVQRLFDTVAPAFAERKGGYTRIYHAHTRPGDNASMAYIEYLNEDLMSFKVGGGKAAEKSKSKTKKTAKKSAAKPAKAKQAKVATA